MRSSRGLLVYCRALCDDEPHHIIILSPHGGWWRGSMAFTFTFTPVQSPPGGVRSVYFHLASWSASLVLIQLKAKSDQTKSMAGLFLAKFFFGFRQVYSRVLSYVVCILSARIS